METQTLLQCPVCRWEGEQDDCEQAAYKTNYSRGHKPQKICLCPQCSVGMAYPIVTKEQLADYYEGDFWKKSQVQILTPQINPGHYASAVSRCQLIKKYANFNQAATLDILDVGAGYGYVGSAAAKENLFSIRKYCVIEPDLVFQKSLKITFESKFPNIDFSIIERIEDSPSEFDLIVFSHILEHLADPGELLRKAKTKLKEGGYIFIDVPNKDYLFKPDIFPHLVFFNDKALTVLVKNAGFEPEVVGGYGRDQNDSVMGQQSHLFLRGCGIVAYKLRRILPVKLLVAFYDWYFGLNERNNNGTWLRCVAGMSRRDSYTA